MKDNEKRKKDHIELTTQSQFLAENRDQRFDYHFLSSPHPQKHLRNEEIGVNFLGYHFHGPLWISSMTGGAKECRNINENLARCARNFQLPFSLGSCRPLLENKNSFDDFNMRPILGPDLPLFANLGIAQIEQFIAENKVDDILEMLKKIEASGLIIHFNYLQEWMQPNGDRFKNPPLETLEKILERVSVPIIAKEVGQGFSSYDLEMILKLPISALEFASLGGTNFTILESLRRDSEDPKKCLGRILGKIGHTAFEMIESINDISDRHHLVCQNYIISGGIQNALDGYFYRNQLKFPSMYGMASGLLSYARKSYDALEYFMDQELDLYHLATKILKIRGEK